ncbi:MAG TPA: histidine kinase, partial [Candidatus Thioglobus autotrophicus]|nr:histidine kinase [Candidatus Thioglobus autotrophicus]
MKYFKLNIGTKLFILYFVISSTLVWLFAHRTSIESAKEVMVEVAIMFSKIASHNIKDAEIDLTTFEGVIVDYFQSPHGDERLQNLAIYITDKDGILILDSRGLSLGTDMRAHLEVDSALSGQRGISRISAETVRGPWKARGVNIEYFYKPEFLHVSSPIYDNKQQVQGVLVVVAPMLDLMDKARLYRFIFYIFLLSLFFGALGSYRISRNIRRLEKYATKLFKGEDVSIPNLNVQFNKLAIALENARSDVELKDDVDEYIETLAHELRTPITGIRLTAENLLIPMGIENYLLEEKDDQKHKELTEEAKVRKQWIKTILKENKKMDLLVTRLLDLSRIERRDKLTNTETLKILPTINNVLKMPTHNRLIISKNITINLDDIEKKSTVFAEKILLDQALGNILKNALEFSPKAGTITIKSSESNTYVTIVVL